MYIVKYIDKTKYIYKSESKNRKEENKYEISRIEICTYSERTRSCCCYEHAEWIVTKHSMHAETQYNAVFYRDAR